MKLIAVVSITAALLVGIAAPVNAQGLLGGVLGGSSDNSAVTLSSGSASDSGLVNVGLGGDSIADVNIGGSSASVLDATVGSGGSSGGLVNVNAGVLGGTVRANVGVGRPNLLNVDIGLGGPGTLGMPGAPGAPGAPGNTRVIGGGLSASSSAAGTPCSGVPANQVANLINSTQMSSSWGRASGVKIQPIAVCADVRAWLKQQFGTSGAGLALQQAVQSDPLMSASLSRTSYSADRVLAVRQSGSQLTLFVY